MRILLFILSLFIFSGCGPEKRFMRLAKKYPHFMKEQITEFHYRDTLNFRDTIHIKDTIYIPGQTDTHTISNDTVIFNDRYSLTKVGSQFIVDVYPQTIYRDSIVYVDTTIYQNKIIEVPGKTVEVKQTFSDWFNSLPPLIVFVMLFLFFIIVFLFLVKLGYNFFKK